MLSPSSERSDQQSSLDTHERDRRLSRVSSGSRCILLSAGHLSGEDEWSLPEVDAA